MDLLKNSTKIENQEKPTKNFDIHTSLTEIKTMIFKSQTINLNVFNDKHETNDRTKFTISDITHTKKTPWMQIKGEKNANLGIRTKDSIIKNKQNTFANRKAKTFPEFEKKEKNLKSHKLKE